jgi:hypothetical protein
MRDLLCSHDRESVTANSRMVTSHFLDRDSGDFEDREGSPPRSVRRTLNSAAEECTA